jgi:hypothetical protein
MLSEKTFACIYALFRGIEIALLSKKLKETQGIRVVTCGFRRRYCNESEVRNAAAKKSSKTHPYLQRIRIIAVQQSREPERHSRLQWL